MSSQLLCEPATIGAANNVVHLASYDSDFRVAAIPHRPTITVVIPTLNESENLRYVLERLPKG